MFFAFSLCRAETQYNPWVGRGAQNVQNCALSSSNSFFSSLFRFPLASSRSFPPRAPFGAPVLAKIRNQNPQSGRSRKKTRNRTCHGHVRSWGRPIAAGFGVQNAMVSDGVGAVSLFFVFSKDFDWKALFLQGVSIKKRWLFRPWPLPTRPGAQNRCLFKGF